MSSAPVWKLESYNGESDKKKKENEMVKALSHIPRPLPFTTSTAAPRGQETNSRVEIAPRKKEKNILFLVLWKKLGSSLVHGITAK